MDVHRLAAVAALPCLCLLATDADAQSRRATFRPIAFELRPSPPPPLATDQRLSELPSSRAPSTGLLESVTVGDTEIGIGRYGVGTVARPRTNMERERMMERENRNIAGAGMRVRF